MAKPRRRTFDHFGRFCLSKLLTVSFSKSIEYLENPLKGHIYKKNASSNLGSIDGFCRIGRSVCLCFNQNTYEVVVNGQGIDLAYTFVNGINLGIVLNCPAEGVSSFLK